MDVAVRFGEGRRFCARAELAEPVALTAFFATTFATGVAGGCDSGAGDAGTEVFFDCWLDFAFVADAIAGFAFTTTFEAECFTAVDLGAAAGVVADISGVGLAAGVAWVVAAFELACVLGVRGCVVVAEFDLGAAGVTAVGCCAGFVDFPDPSRVDTLEMGTRELSGACTTGVTLGVAASPPLRAATAVRAVDLVDDGIGIRVE